VRARTVVLEGIRLKKAYVGLDAVAARTVVTLLQALDPTGVGPLPGDSTAIGVSGNPPIGIGFGLSGTVALTSLAPDA
jgi:pantoate kinase